MGLFNRTKNQPEQAAASGSSERDVLATGLATPGQIAAAHEKGEQPAESAAQHLAGEGLRSLVALMRRKTEGQATLSLTQQGNDMNYTLHHRGQECEAGVVTPATEWFDAVAAFYVEEEKGERGAWNRALIVVNPAIEGQGAISASLMNTETSKTYNLNFTLGRGESAPAPAVKTAKQDTTADAGGPVETSTETAAEAENRMSRISARLHKDEDDAAPTPSFQARADQQEEVEAQKDTEAREDAAAPVDDEPAVAAEAEQTPAVEPEQTPAAEPEQTPAAESADPVSEDSLPTQLDDSEFDDHLSSSTQLTGQAGAGANEAGEERPTRTSATTLDAPMTSASVDVAPSYASQAQAKPSSSRKAPGNLVLTEAEVVSRFAPAYEALFGAEGTARDVSTVLIRVRTLGSYYDALTHVRRHGFWEQVRTFDLIPEETLAILQLKADSYHEGHGSPLAMSIRFTPGTPVETDFNYSDEEAFVTYPEHLPAQQYVEELRMFPRTGEHIPAHMSEALASWNF